MPEGKTIFFSVMQSPVGPLLLAAGEDGLRHLQFHRGELPKAAKGEVWIESRERLEMYEQQIAAYFRGKLREFTGKLDFQGTSFQKDCWQALLRIPYGETRTYAEIAREIGRPQAFRAVGQANHDNPIAIIVPCHRVLGGDRALTGYGGGLSTKEQLLRLEGAEFRATQEARAAKKRAGQNSQQARFDY
jgi:methylated-DNA-[protein]-cysteine S-methyltransferase